MRLTRARLKKIIKEEIDHLGAEGGTGDVQSMLDKYTDEKVRSKSARPRRGVANSFALFLKKIAPPPPDEDFGGRIDDHNRAYYDSFNPGSIKPTEQMLHKNKDGTYSIVIRLDYNQGVVLWGKMIEGEDFIFVDKVVKSYYVPSGQTP